ncbi:MAG: dephospho-CoA kinase [Gammaproteobacteria bacterium]
MLVVGLTGGIASGKSAATAGFARLGVPVIDADVISHELTEPGEPGYTKLIAALGEGMLDASGRLDRPRLRQRLFADPACRKTVEAILHPLILARMRADRDRIVAPYVIAAVPLLAESAAAHALVDRVLVIDCPETLQIERLIARDGSSQAEARAILASQVNRDRRWAAGDDILFNTGTLAELAQATGKLHGYYRDLTGVTPPTTRTVGVNAAPLDGK